MKALKIELSNTTAIEAELHSVNGKAKAHSYTDFSEIKAIADKFESKVYALLGNKKAMTGAKIISESGSSVAKSYKGKRVSTIVTIERKSSGWFLIAIGTGYLYNDSGKSELFLTAAQDVRAVVQFRKNYNLIK
jgi:hypothetical protein